jgi:hypothetical protein
MRKILTPLAAIALTSAVAVTPVALARHASTAAASGPETVGFGLQSDQPGAPDSALFGVFASGLGTAATGIVEFSSGPASKPKVVTGKVTCMTISGNDAIITLQYKVKRVLHWAVAEAVDNSNPTSAAAPDAWRVSFEGFILPTDTPDCYTPMLAPVQITPSGGGADIRVETGP